MEFNTGFEYNGVMYGWYDEKLYRLPQKLGKRFYPTFECGKYGNGYYVGRDRKSMAQLKDMTVAIDVTLPRPIDKNNPF